MTLNTEMLLSLLTADPAQRGAQVSKLLAQQLGAGTATSPEAFPGAASPVPPSAPEAGSPTSALQREAQLLDEEMRRLLALITNVATALGACRRCLGADESCCVCGGNGTAGSSDPDRELFAGLIAPAVVRVADEEAAVDTS